MLGVSGWVSSSRRPEPAGSLHSSLAGGSWRGGRGWGWAGWVGGSRLWGWGFVAVERDEWSELIGGEFLADFAGGF